MNIDEIKLTQLINKCCTTFGIDSVEHCWNKLHFKNYSKNVIYKFNQMGYRDEEWPNTLNNDIWAVGDSFTLGLGQPFEETWVNIVQKKINQRVINVSMNGASNDWIARRTQFILDNCNPAVILIQWSYTHRREDKNTALDDEDRANHFSKDLETELELLTQLSNTEQLDRLMLLDNLDIENCLQNIMSISNKHNIKIIHSFVPEFFNPQTDPNVSIYSVLTTHHINFFPAQEQVDFARDGFHYDIKTATQYADKYVEQLQTTN